MSTAIEYKKITEHYINRLYKTFMYIHVFKYTKSSTDECLPKRIFFG